MAARRFRVRRIETTTYERSYSPEELADIFAAELAADGLTVDDLAAEVLLDLLGGGAGVETMGSFYEGFQRHGDVEGHPFIVREEEA